MKKITFLILLFHLFYTGITQAQIAVNEDNSLPDASALMDIKSTNKGLLIPRMTSTERVAIPSPATGLMVYDNTTNSFWYYNVSVWTEIGARASAIAILQNVTRMDIGGSEQMVIKKNTTGNTVIDVPRNIFTNSNGYMNSRTGGTESDTCSCSCTFSSNRHFNIQKSSNGIDFENIGKVYPHGTTQQEQAYDFLDNMPFLGTNYYRLQQGDYDNKSEYSNVISIETNPNTTSIKIYPISSERGVND